MLVRSNFFSFNRSAYFTIYIGEFNEETWRLHRELVGVRNKLVQKYVPSSFCNRLLLADSLESSASTCFTIVTAQNL